MSLPSIAWGVQGAGGAPRGEPEGGLRGEGGGDRAERVRQERDAAPHHGSAAAGCRGGFF